MNIRKNDSDEFRSLWDEARRASRSVAEWPAWKRGEVERAPSLTVETAASVATPPKDAGTESSGNGSLRS